MTTNPFDFDHEEGNTVRSPQVPGDPSELLDRYGPDTMPDPDSLRVPDDPGELMDEDEDDDPDQGFDDRESYSM
ncbi:hypothetical protein KDL01_25665 [Actinospica durhamensis]|uniref:Uncharacterized protein n=1 Tax=Actinospica durhamensis TaxID=1508375 RepID=A0A941EXA3_9ACTN|nr:hypothetical protein [Actinospica durhamensis]MBR7836694.1 hypothetical protein [Actinospica durhamensis]